MSNNMIWLASCAFFRELGTNMGFFITNKVSYMSVSLLLLWVSTTRNLSHVCTYLYDNFDCIYYTVNTMFRLWRDVYNYLFGILQSPDKLTWMSISSMTKISETGTINGTGDEVGCASTIATSCRFLLQSFNKKVAEMNIRYADEYVYDYTEQYFGVNERWDDIVEKIISIHQYIESANTNQVSPINVGNEEDSHLLTIARNVEDYNVRVSTETLLISNISRLSASVLSSIRFIAIEYFHPKMNYQVSISLPRGMYISGNEILSSVFVLRWLTNNLAKNSYVFDMDYVIRIMDSNIKYVEITSRQYCILSEDSWFIEEFV